MMPMMPTPPLTLVPYDPPRHYPVLVGWWLARDKEPEPPEALPGGGRPGFGVFAMLGGTQHGEAVACGFVYETGTLLWLGPHYLNVNPALHGVPGGKALGNFALDAVVHALEAYVETSGGGALGTFAEEPAVIARARRMGYGLRGRIPMLGKWIAASPALGAAACAAACAEGTEGGTHG